MKFWCGDDTLSRESTVEWRTQSLEHGTSPFFCFVHHLNEYHSSAGDVKPKIKVLKYVLAYLTLFLFGSNVVKRIEYITIRVFFLTDKNTSGQLWRIQSSSINTDNCSGSGKAVGQVCLFCLCVRTMTFDLDDAFVHLIPYRSSLGVKVIRSNVKVHGHRMKTVSRRCDLKRRLSSYYRCS